MENLWERCKEELEKKVSSHHYAAYIKPTKSLNYKDNELSLLVPSAFTANWLTKNYVGVIMEVIDEKTNAKNKIKFVIETSKPREVRTPAPVTMNRKKTIPSIFKQQHSFDSFVVGKCNEFAYASALSCAKSPGSKYNPLFLYGGVGLGKTHLMQAIGRHIVEKDPAKTVLYLSSEQFINQMISSIQKGKMDIFRRKFRNVDALLVDDIQFIAGKDRTQEEFFHTFNELFEMGKQIVISSDQFPKDIKKLEERLKSRFEWGLIADIQPAELETKIAIINKKAELNGYDIPRDVAEYLAETIKSNIRELEGCMARVVAFASLTGRSINLELAKETVEGVYAEAKKHIEVQQIMKAVTAYYSLKPYDLKSKSRTRRITVPRQLAMFLSREYTEESLPQIGRYFGGRDHSTVIHACNKMKKDIEVNTKIYNDLTAIKRVLGL